MTGPDAPMQPPPPMPPPGTWPPGWQPVPPPRKGRGGDVGIGVLLAFGMIPVAYVMGLLASLLDPPYPLRPSLARQLLMDALGQWWWAYPIVVTVVAAVKRRPGVLIGYWVTVAIAVTVFLLTCFAILSNL